MHIANKCQLKLPTFLKFINFFIKQDKILDKPLKRNISMTNININN